MPGVPDETRDARQRFTFFLTVKQHSRYKACMTDLSNFDQGFLVGLLVGEGSFGGDGKQPQVTLRMHTRHEALFRWLMRQFPNSKLYGPYNHGGRSYYQWMARGRTLVVDLLPLLEGRITADIDAHAAASRQWGGDPKTDDRTCFIRPWSAWLVTGPTSS